MSPPEVKTANMRAFIVFNPCHILRIDVAIAKQCRLTFADVIHEICDLKDGVFFCHPLGRLSLIPLGKQKEQIKR